MVNAPIPTDTFVHVETTVDDILGAEETVLETNEKYEPLKALGGIIRRNYPLIIVAAIAIGTHIIRKSIEAENDAIIAALVAAE